MTDLKHLRELCDAATDGGWRWLDTVEELKQIDNYANDRDLAALVGKDNKLICNFGNCEDYYPTEGEEPSPEDKAFIAATDPQTVRALIDEVERLRFELKIANRAFDICHRYNGYDHKSDYFDEARQALKGTDNE